MRRAGEGAQVQSHRSWRQKGVTTNAPPTVGAAPLSKRLKTSRPRSSVPRGRKKLRHSATMTAAIIDNREIADRCRERRKPAAKNTQYSQPAQPYRADHRRGVTIKFAPGRYAACPAGAFRCIRYRKAYHSLCFRGLAMAPKISRNHVNNNDQ